MDNVWVFGASKPLGRNLSEALSVQYDVITFGRTPEPQIFGLSKHIDVDFADHVTLRKAIEDQFRSNIPTGILFCQRYRSESAADDLSFLKAAIDVELAPVLMAQDVIRDNGASGVSIVAFSSVAARLTNIDVPIGYHLAKALTVSAVAHLAALESEVGTRFNCVLLGDYLKYPRDSYSEIELAKFSEIENVSYQRRLCGLQDIIGVIRFLLSEDSAYMSGQVIELDGTVASKSLASILRLAVSD